MIECVTVPVYELPDEGDFSETGFIKLLTLLGYHFSGSNEECITEIWQIRAIGTGCVPLRGKCGNLLLGVSGEPWIPSQRWDLDHIHTNLKPTRQQLDAVRLLEEAEEN